MTNIERERENLKRELNSSLPWMVGEINRKLEDRRNEIANKEVTFKDGVARWSSNNRAVPTECAVQFEYVGAPIDVEKTAEAEGADMDDFFKSYREAQKNRKRSDEEMFEMRAAFGEGATVVDVITGERIRL